MSQPLFVGQELDVFVEKLSFNGGRGVARHEGVVVFVEGAAPQEDARIRLTKIHKRYAQARLLKVLRPGESRRTPPCPLVPDCGGCNLQHITYSEQLKQKALILSEQLRPLLKVSTPTLKDFVPSDKEFHYRNRVQFHLENGKVGFHKRASHQVIDTEKCYLVEDEINSELSKLRDKARRSPRKDRIELRSTNSTGNNFFSQVNSSQNEGLQKKLINMVETLSPHEFWDLYGGAGNFSIPLAQKYPDIAITCVEASGEAVAFGRKRAQELNLANIEWVHSPVEKFLKAAELRRRLILIDPPRAGLSDEARKLLYAHLALANLIYLSCNPSSFVRDALGVVENSPLRPQWIEGLDMFPQTDHIELLSFFT